VKSFYFCIKSFWQNKQTFIGIQIKGHAADIKIVGILTKYENNYTNGSDEDIDDDARIYIYNRNYRMY